MSDLSASITVKLELDTEVYSIDAKLPSGELSAKEPFRFNVVSNPDKQGDVG